MGRTSRRRLEGEVSFGSRVWEEGVLWDLM